MKVILLILSICISLTVLVFGLTVINALITLPKNRLKTVIDNSEKGYSTLTMLKIWVWAKQDKLVSYLVVKERKMTKSAKIRNLVIFCISGFSLCLTSILWNYDKDETFSKKNSKGKSTKYSVVKKIIPVDSVIMMDDEDIKAIQKLRKFTKGDSIKESEIPIIW